MGVILGDMPDATVERRTALAHVKREPSILAPALCGDYYGFAVKVEPGGEMGEPWPFDAWCEVCEQRHRAAREREETVKG